MQVADKGRKKQVSTWDTRHAFELHVFRPYVSDQILTVTKFTARTPRTDHFYMLRDSVIILKMLFARIERDQAAASIPVLYNLTVELEQFVRFRSTEVRLDKLDSLCLYLHCCAFRIALRPLDGMAQPDPLSDLVQR